MSEKQYPVEVHQEQGRTDGASDEAFRLTVEQLEKELTPLQLKFVYAYVVCLNGTEAAGLAGYDGDDASLASMASRLLRNVKVSRLISAICRESQVSQEQLAARLQAITLADATDFYDVGADGEIQVNLDKAKRRGSMPALRSLSQRKTTRTTKEGETVTTVDVNIQLHNPLPAAKLLAEMLGFTGQTSSGGGLTPSQKALLAVLDKVRARKHIQAQTPQ